MTENNTLEFEFFETKNAVPKIVAFFLQEPPYLNLKKEQKNFFNLKKKSNGLKKKRKVNLAASSQKQLIYYSIFQDLLTLFEGHKMQDSKLSLPVSFVKAERVTVFKSHNKSNTVSNNEAVTEEGIFTSTKN